MMPYQQYLIPVLVIALIAACAIAFYAISRLAKIYVTLKEREVALAAAHTAQEALQRQMEEHHALEEEHKKLIEERAAAVTERAEAMRQIELIRDERNRAREDLLQAEVRVAEAVKNVELTEQRMEEMLKRMRDWETQREEHMQSTRAAVLKVSGEVSTKLLEDHKREMETAKKANEEIAKKTTEELFKQFSEVSKSVAALKDVSHTNRNQMELVMRALTNPSGAGKMAEIGLENSLKNMGLEVGRDFQMQYHIAGEDGGASARPDAIIYLPQDMVMVVDAKASKFLLELAEVEGTPEEEFTQARLKKSMNEHLRALAGRDYAAAITRSFKSSGREGALGHVFNVMYLPSESAIEKLRRADPEFDQKLERAGIILAGPTSLAGLFSLAKSQIAAARQSENSARIIEAAEAMMEGVVVALSHADRLGRSIHSTAKSFEEFGRSVNRSVLPRLRKLTKLGASPAKQKEIPAPLATYDIRRIEETIEVETETVAESQRLIGA